VAAILGLVLWIVGLAIDARQALYSYLTAYAAVLSVVLGMLILLMSIHAARSEWPVVVRRLIEHVTALLPLMALLSLPLILGMRQLYPWAGEIPATEHIREAIEHKRPWLNPTFFIVRAVIYFACWIAIGWFLRTWSLRQDADGAWRWKLKQWRLSGIGIVIVAHTMTFAAFDWLMSLDPTWQSSIYGVYYFSGGFVAAFALLALIMARLQWSEVLQKGHFLSTGKYLLAFVIFWAYSLFAQYFLIWITDLPREVTWWLPRSRGWAGVSIALAVAHFVIPFFVLLSRDLKMKPRRLAFVSGWLLAAHYLDVYWLVMPALHKDGSRPHWLDFAALLFVVGASLAFGIWRARGTALIPYRDQQLAVSIAYEGS
jgi:hypothetical protein